MRDDSDPADREILDIIPERYDADPDSRAARKGAHTRTILTIALGLLAIAALGVAARHILYGEAPKEEQTGVPVIHADDKPIKTKPADRGGMDVPNQDKLVYQNMGGNDGNARTERLLPPPEQPQAPPAQQPRTPSIKPAFPVPPPQAAPSGGPPAESQAAVPVNPPPAAAPPVPPAASGQTAVAAATTARSPVVPAATTGWLVQLAAVRSEADAKNEWGRIRNANKDLLGDLPTNVMRVDLGAKGVFWRLRAGPLDEGHARSLCAALAKRSQGCLLVKK
jgi:cell division septation protein DedD